MKESFKRLLNQDTSDASDIYIINHVSPGCRCFIYKHPSSTVCLPVKYARNWKAFYEKIADCFFLFQSSSFIRRVVEYGLVSCIKESNVLWAILVQ